MKKYLVVSVIALALSACANSSLLVEKPNVSKYRTDSATLVAGQSTIEIDPKDMEYTQKKLEEEFFGGKDPVFAKGDGVTIKYRYLSFDEGDRALRYLLGGLAGGAKLVLEVEFIDKSGNSLAIVRSEASVAGGFAGGSHRSGVDKAAQKLAEYARQEFKK